RDVDDVVEASPLQNPQREMRPEARAAVQVDAHASRQLAEAEAQLIERQVERSRDMAFLILVDVADVEDERRRTAGLRRGESGLETGCRLQRAIARDVVLRDEGRDVY